MVAQYYYRCRIPCESQRDNTHSKNFGMLIQGLSVTTLLLNSPSQAAELDEDREIPRWLSSPSSPQAWRLSLGNTKKASPTSRGVRAL